MNVLNVTHKDGDICLNARFPQPVDINSFDSDKGKRGSRQIGRGGPVRAVDRWSAEGFAKRSDGR